MYAHWNDTTGWEVKPNTCSACPAPSLCGSNPNTCSLCDERRYQAEVADELRAWKRAQIVANRDPYVTRSGSTELDYIATYGRESAT